MPYGSMWKGLAGAFSGIQPAIQDYQKRQQIEEEQRQRQQSVNQEGERIGLSRQELEFRKQEAEDKDLMEKAQMLQPGQRIPEDIRAGLDQRKIPYYVHPDTGELLQPIWSGAQAAEYKLRQQEVQNQAAAAGRYEKQFDIQNQQLQRQELNDAMSRYLQEKGQIANYLSSLQKQMPSKEVTAAVRNAIRERDTLDARYRVLLKRAGLKDDELNLMFSEGGGPAANPFATAIGQWIQTQGQQPPKP